MMAKLIDMAPTLQLHHAGQWRNTGSIQSLSDSQCRFEYLTEYIFSSEPQPVSLGLPVAFRDFVTATDPAVPPFLYDLVPQGRGRAYLLSLLGRSDSDSLVMPLLLAGAFNPIGRLRISTAVSFYEDQLRKNPDRGPLAGFAIEDIESNADTFLEHLSLHAMLSGGTTGVQGVAPKFLLTQDEEDRWFADLALPDARARRHWIVKLPRGREAEDLLVHRHEAAYLRLAKTLGLRTHGDPVLRGRMLFSERFDRLATPDGVVRLHQESLSSLAGLRGFGVATTQNQLLAALRQHASHPTEETIEFMRRDAFNLALRNTDNHARNTAVQVLPNGCVQLTPLFDVSPMFKDPEVVPRSVHWRDINGRRLDDWSQVLDTLALGEDERRSVARALREFGEQLARVPSIAADHGIEQAILSECLRSIETQIEQLLGLRA